LACYVRLMYREDVDQVTAIDREAFPTQWPPANYKHEMRNRLAHYIVACDDEKPIEQPGVKESSENGFARLASGLRRLFSRDLSSNEGKSSLTGHYIVGFVGFWIMADEAHITSIAVRENYRRQGIGELLMVAVMDMAKDLKARIVTLEVRVSNTGAQKLYSRYGFTRVGIRKGYYTDNREDAVVMSTENIASVSYTARFSKLKEALSRKPGISVHKVRH
jgi:ribosomal-protein-alanine N-acetyltransferase